MKIKAPFKVTYDSSTRYRIWGFGLGYLPMCFLCFGYNVRNSAGTLPSGIFWQWTRKGQVQVSDRISVD
jgi:hypothetical protein